MWIINWIALSVPRALAQGIQIENPLACGEEAGQCLQDILQGLIYLAAPIAALMILIGGFQIMFANGAEEKIKKGRNTIIYATIGFAIILLSTAVVAVVEDFLSTAGS